MQSCSQRPISFEYQPLQTEMGNYNPEASDASFNDNTMIYSRIQDQTEEKRDNCALINSNKVCVSFETLQSLRISRSVSGKKDNEKMLLQGMNNSSSDCEEDLMQTPKKKPNTKIVIGALFDCSTTNNKNIIVSELDIQISSNNKLKAKLDNKYQGSHLSTVSTENRKNLMKDFNTKIEELYPSNEMAIAIAIEQSRYNKTPYHSTMTEGNKTTSKFRNKIPHCNVKKNPRPLNTECNVNKAKSRKNKDVCSSMKKISCRTAIFDILQRIKDKHIVSSSKSKNNGALSYISTAYQDTTSSNKQKQTSTERSIKKTDIPFISSFKYNEIKPTQRPGSLKQKMRSIKEFDKLTNKVIKSSNSKKDCSMNCKAPTINNNSNTSQMIRTSTISNSRSKSKSKQKSSCLKEKEATSFNLNYSFFHTIQSITNQRTKYNLLNTIPAKTSSTKAYFPGKTNFLLKDNKQKLKHWTIQTKKANIKKAMLPCNYSHLNTKCNKPNALLFNESIQSHRNKPQLQTPLSTKPNIQIYKNSIKHVMITPLITLKMKLLNNQKNSKYIFNKKENKSPGYGYGHH